MYPEFIRGPRGVSLHRVVTVFGKKEFVTIRIYCKRNRLSLYALAKAATRHYVQRHACSGCHPLAGCCLNRRISRYEDLSANLPFVDRVDRLAEPRQGLRVLRREVIGILDEREMLESSQDIRRQLPIDVPH